MRIVIVASSYNKYVFDIISLLDERKINVDTLLLGSKVEKMRFKFSSIKRIYKRLGVIELIKRLYDRKKDVVHTEYSTLSEAQDKFGFSIEYYDYVNSGQVIARLLPMENKVVILAGSGIVDTMFLRAAGDNCVNGHPAILPGLRGVDVLEWALFKRKGLGVTSHLVTSKVDAGDILQTKKIKIVKNETYPEFRERVNFEQATVLVEGVNSLLEGKERNRNNVEESSLCFVAPSKVRKVAEGNYYKNRSKV